MAVSTFLLKEEFIPLIQLLKYTGLAESGAHASELVLSNSVLCNGSVETRKRYKVRKGDRIQVEDQVIEIK
jgi:ribosome-associated protein